MALYRCSGSGGGIPLLTEEQWDLLTTEQKQAYGLTAIQKTVTGFNRGLLVNGADYVETYLPYSNHSDVICEAYVNNFDSSANTWGNGTSVVQYIDGKPTLNTSENAISFPTKTSGVIGYVDLGASNSPFTAYLVGKMINPLRDERFFSCSNSRSSQQGIYMACVNSNLEIDTWGNIGDTGISASANYVVAVLKFQSSGNAIGFVNNVSISKSPNACGRYVTLARSDIDSSTTNAVPSDILVKYVGVVNEAEENINIMGNIVNLYNTFID